MTYTLELPMDKAPAAEETVTFTADELNGMPWGDVTPPGTAIPAFTEPLTLPAPDAEEEDDDWAEEYDGLVVEGLTGEVQSIKDVEIVLKRLRYHRGVVSEINARRDEEIAKVNRIALEEVERLNEAAGKMASKSLGSIAHYEAKYFPGLKMWAREWLKGAGPKVKSCVTLFGRVGFKSGSSSRAVTDAEKAISYLESSGLSTAIKTTRTVLVSNIPKDVAVPGVTVTTTDPKFYVET